MRSPPTSLQDNAGNLTNDGTSTYTYDALSRMTQRGSTSYTYNGDGVLVYDGTTRYTNFRPPNAVLNTNFSRLAGALSILASAERLSCVTTNPQSQVETVR